MFRFLFVVPAVAGGAVVAGVVVAGVVVAGVVGGLVFQEPLRRAAKSMAKTAIRGAGLVGDGCRTIRDEVDDARAEVEWERGERGTGSAPAGPGNRNGSIG